MPISPGLIVHFHPNGRAAVGGTILDNDQPMAGIVAFDHGDGTVNLCIIGHDGVPFAFRAPLIENGQAIPERGTVSYCCWPEENASIIAKKQDIESQDIPTSDLSQQGQTVVGEPQSEQPQTEQSQATPGGDTVGVEAPSTEVANPGGDQGTDVEVSASETVSAAST